MRTTPDMDDELLEAAKSLALTSNRTEGSVWSQLAPRAPTSAPPESVRVGVGGFVPFESRGGRLTHEQIARMRERDVY